MSDENKNLELLGIFHYIVGGITGFFACFPLIHIVLGSILIFIESGGDDALPPQFIGWLFIFIGSAILLLGWAMAAAIIIAGRKLIRKQSRTYCLVIAGLECMMMPYGTVLGVFTIVMLTKEPVKKLFEAGEKN